MNRYAAPLFTGAMLRIVVGLTAMQQFDVYYDLDRRRVGVVTR